MPQASDDLRERMNQRFGDPIRDAGPIQYLKDQGYEHISDWRWKPRAGVTCLKDMSRDEFDCLIFLVHEWDWGGLVEATPLEIVE